MMKETMKSSFAEFKSLTTRNNNKYNTPRTVISKKKSMIWEVSQQKIKI